MSGTLRIVNNFELDPSQGKASRGQQGEPDSPFMQPYQFSVDGQKHALASELATATAVTLYDNDDDNPTSFDYAHIVTDFDGYLQIIGTGTNVVIPIYAYRPVVLNGTMLAAANTTAITGSAEPSLTVIDSVILANYSGATGNYDSTFIN